MSGGRVGFVGLLVGCWKGWFGDLGYGVVWVGFGISDGWVTGLLFLVAGYVSIFNPSYSSLLVREMEMLTSRLIVGTRGTRLV